MSDERDFDESRLYLEEPLTVTLARPASFSGGATASIPVAHVQEQPAEENEVETPSGGSLEGTRTTFRMWLIECLAMPPHRGYLITKADGKAHEISSVDVLCKGRQFRCHATQRPT